MLVLTRAKGQDICIGDGIIIRVCDIRGGRVRLGLIAPAEVGITRSELGPIATSAEGHVDDTVIE